MKRQNMLIFFSNHQILENYVHYIEQLMYSVQKFHIFQTIFINNVKCHCTVQSTMTSTAQKTILSKFFLKKIMIKSKNKFQFTRNTPN